jgi:hypothetical protein
MQSFQNPVFTVYNTGVKSKKTEKKSNFEVNLEDIRFNNAIVQINKPDGNRLLSAGTLI